MKVFEKKWVSVLFLGLAVIPGQAALFSKKNSQTRGPALLDWNPSVRAEGMGGAYVGVSDDGGALFWNPAGMGQLEQPEMAFSYANEFGEQTRGNLSLVRPLWWGQERRTWGLRVAYSSVKPFELTESGVSDGTVHPQDFVLGVSYEQPWGPVSLGGTLKGIRQDISVDSASTWATDVGILGPGKRFQWGASLLNLGPALKTNTGTLDLPLRFLGGGNWAMVDRGGKGGHDKVIGSFQLDAPVGDVPRPQLGLEWARRWENRMEFSGRLGYRSRGGDQKWMDQMTFGLGFSREPFGVQYAYLSQDALGATHRFEIVWKFGAPLEQEKKRDQLLSRAETLYGEGRMVRARKSLEEALLLSPGNYHARRLRKKIDSRIATSLDPETLFILGEQAFSEGRYEQSADLFRRLVEQDSHYPEGRERMEKAEEKAGEERLRAAETRLKEERDREDRLRRSRARKLMGEKKWREAIIAWGRVLELVPNEGVVLKAVGRCREEAYQSAVDLQKRGEEKAAIEMYRVSQEGIKSYKGSAEKIEAMTSSMVARGKDESQKLYEQGMSAYSLKDFNQARALFERALKADPTNKKVERALERLKKEMGRTP